MFIVENNISKARFCDPWSQTKPLRKVMAFNCPISHSIDTFVSECRWKRLKRRYAPRKSCQYTSDINLMLVQIYEKIKIIMPFALTSPVAYEINERHSLQPNRYTTQDILPGGIFSQLQHGI